MRSHHSRVKIGRNDPCSCGSGRKYKHCCERSRPIPEESVWRRQHEDSERLNRELMRFAERNFDHEMEEAWADFNLQHFPPLLEKFPNEGQIFMPYYLFLWTPWEVSKGARRQPGDAGIVVGEFLQERERALSEVDLQFIVQALTEPLSFYEVVWCEPGSRMRLRDILLGHEVEVIEHSASQGTSEGDIMYAQIWHAPVPVMAMSAPFRIPPRWKADVIDLRARLKKKAIRGKRALAAKDLIRYEDEVRETYLNIRDSLFNPPRVCNTDGDPLLFHTMEFRIGSPAVAFDALAPLAWGRTRVELLEDAEFDEQGAIHTIEFDWIKEGNKKHKSWDNTIMGHIKISGSSLTATVNSRQRADQLRNEIEKRLGIAVTHQSTTAQTTEELLKSSPPDHAKAEREQRDLMSDPEIRQHFQEYLQKQVESWVHEKLPVLRGKTPLEAVKDPDGREAVECLLLDWERRGNFPSGARPDFNAVRRLLNLEPIAS
jgi:hypothetical protein